MASTGASTAPATSEELLARASELARAEDRTHRVEELIEVAAGDRHALEAARDRVAAHLHIRVDDWEATRTLTLLNSALSGMPRHDPLDWRVRWNQRFRKP
jgi:hypothetical protein